jgi:hypothetical protein
MHVALEAPRDDFCVRVMSDRKVEQLRNQQRMILHEAEHESLQIIDSLETCDTLPFARA